MHKESGGLCRKTQPPERRKKVFRKVLSCNVIIACFSEVFKQIGEIKWAAPPPDMGRGSARLWEPSFLIDIIANHGGEVKRRRAERGLENAGT